MINEKINITVYGTKDLADNQLDGLMIVIMTVAASSCDCFAARDKKRKWVRRI